MHTAILDRNMEALAAVRRHVAFSANLRNQVGALTKNCPDDDERFLEIQRILSEASDPTSWRVIDHCAAVTRAYALFESFVMEILREYLAFLSSAYKLSDLGVDFGAKYTRGIGKILQDQDKHRYRNLDVASVISGVSDALAGKAGYQIQAEALLRAEQNLRMSELHRLFSDCGLVGLESWVTRHPAVTDFFAEQSRLSETAASELKQIVDYRNEAAHGEVDDVLGPEVLIEFTHFFEAMSRGLIDFIQYDTLRRAKELSRATVVGVISERYRNDVVVAKVSNATLSIGDQLYVFKKGMTAIAKIKSIQMNSVNMDSITVTDEMEVGLRIGVRVNVGCELLRLV